MASTGGWGSDPVRTTQHVTGAKHFLIRQVSIMMVSDRRRAPLSKPNREATIALTQVVTASRQVVKHEDTDAMTT